MLLPDFGSFHAQHIGTIPTHLLVAGAKPSIVTTDNKLFSISFVVEYDGQQMMGTLEYQGSKADAFKVANDLVTNGVYCQARPDLAYTTTDAQERVVPFRLIEEPKQLTSVARDRIEAAIAKRARRAAKRQA